jgi:hypothetical protein
MLERAGRAAVCLALCSGGLVLACSAAPGPRRPPRLDRAELGDAGAIATRDFPAWTRPSHGDLRQALTIAIRDGVSGRGFEGRGVVVVRPGHALRMILLGPGGTTAMDVWIRDGRWRVAIPALDRVVRGDGSTPKEKMRGLPIGLLSRWLVAPFGGSLVAAHAGRVDVSGRVVSDETTGPGGARSFVAFSRRDGVFEARARQVTPSSILAHAWWFESGKLVAYLDGEEQSLGDAIVPRVAHYVSLDPPMRVDVTATETSPIAPGELGPATFADPDQADSP